MLPLEIRELIICDSWSSPLVLCSIALFIRLFHYLPFLLLLLHNPVERIFFQGTKPNSFFHTGLNENKGWLCCCCC